MGVPSSGVDHLRSVFDMHIDAGLHHGAQLAVYHEGRLVADFAGGITGPDGDPETPDRRHLLFSCTKPFVGACVHHLVDRGALAYDDRVIEHWPDFAPPDSEKAEATVRHLLSHQAGLPASDFDTSPEQWGDWDAAATAMEETSISFRPGTTAAYHSLTYGWLVGELVRRVSGTAVDAYAREHVFSPLDITHTTIGLPEEVPATDVATLVGFEPFDRCREPGTGLGTLSTVEAAALFNRERIQRAVVPAATGIGTAREMARFYAAIAGGGTFGGARLLSESTVEEATRLQADVERDGTMGMRRRYAMGFERGGPAWDKYATASPSHVVGHGGLGSIVGWADPEADLAMAYVTNGIREEYEHTARASAMADAVRSVFV